MKSLPHWLGSRFGRQSSQNRFANVGRRGARRKNRPLWIESLEERLMLATVNWIGGTGDWNTVSNWSDGVINRLPVADDDVVIPAGVTVTHSSGTHTVTSITDSGNFTLSGGTLIVDGSLAVSGTFSLSGGTLQNATVASGTTVVMVSNTTTLNNVTVDGTLDVTGTISSGGLTLSDATGSWDFAGGTISGGTLDVAAGSTTNPRLIAAAQNSGTLAGGVTLNAGLDMAVLVNNGFTVFVTGGLTLNQTLNIGNTSGTTAAGLSFNSATQTLGGSGTVVFGGHASNLLTPQVGQMLTIEPTITIRGKSGNVGASSRTLINQGVIQADTTSGTINVNWGTNGSNSGTIQASSGGTLDASPTTFTNFSSGTLTGGTYRVIGSSTMRLGIPSDILTNAATIVLDGSGANFYRGPSGTTNALAGLTTIAAAGSLTIQNGRNLTLAGALAHSGSKPSPNP